MRGWDRRNAYYFQLISSLADYYGFDIETPFEDLDDKFQKVILYGSGKEVIEFRYLNERKGIKVKHHPFEGVLRNMERRYRETESNVVREELARYLSTHPCPDCEGTRLNRSARHVFIEERALPDITTLPVGDASAFFAQLKLYRQARRNRRKNRQGNSRTPGLPGQRRPELSFTGAQRRHPVWR